MELAVSTVAVMALVEEVVMKTLAEEVVMMTLAEEVVMMNLAEEVEKKARFRCTYVMTTTAAMLATSVAEVVEATAVNLTEKVTMLVRLFMTRMAALAVRLA